MTTGVIEIATIKELPFGWFNMVRASTLDEARKVPCAYGYWCKTNAVLYYVAKADA